MMHLRGPSAQWGLDKAPIAGLDGDDVPSECPVPPGRRPLRTPLRRLAVAVLFQALNDFLQPTKTERRYQDQAFWWFMSSDRSHPLSFLNICDGLGLEPDPIRNELVKRRKA